MATQLTSDSENFAPLITDPKETQSFGLDIISIVDMREKALVLHEKPFSNQVYCQDLGFRIHKYQIETIWNDHAKYRDPSEGVTPVLGQVANFLEFLKNGKIFIFQHPTWGRIFGNIADIEILEDDTLRCASVKLTFIEEQNTAAVNLTLCIARTMINLQRAMVEQNYDFMLDQLNKELGAQASEITNAKDYDPTKTISENLPKLSGAVRAYVTKLDQVIAFCNSVASNIIIPANSVIGSLVYTVDAVGAIIEPFVKMAERITLLNQTLISTPSKFIDAVNMGLNTASVAIAKLNISFAQTLLYSSGASVIGYHTSVYLEEDESKKNSIKALENTYTFSAAGRLIFTQDYQTVLTLNDLESLLAGIRSIYQTALGDFDTYITGTGITQIVLTGTDNRNLQYLKDQSKALQEYINTMKIERLSLKQITVTNQPLYSVCLANNMSYQATERLLLINPQIKNPMFVEGPINIYA